MNIIALDFESLYTKDYSLKKMPIEEYVRNKNFELQCCSIFDASVGVPIVTAGLEQTKSFLSKLDWQNSLLVAHNAHFDAAIATWWCHVRPAGVLCTQQIWRTLGLGAYGGESLAAVIAYGLQHGWNVVNKDSEALADVQGLRWDDMTEAQQKRLVDYCRTDAQNCYEIFRQLGPLIPTGELYVMSESIRCFTEPRILLDSAALRSINDDHAAMQQSVMDKAGISEITELRSDAKFFELLGDALGGPEHVPTKINAKGITKPAFAKTDTAFTDLLESPSDQVRGLVAARLATKSTITASRTERLYGISQRGAWPVHLNFGAAHTLRFGGGGQVNPQNLSKKDGIRDTLIAPKGCQYVVVDLSQIEARMVAYLAGQMDLVDAFANGVDVYCRFGNRSGLFDYKITKATFDERFLCKGVVLGGGFGASEHAMERQIKSLAFALGLDVNLDVDWQALKNAYRDQNREIVNLWWKTNRILKNLAGGAKEFRMGTDDLVHFQQTEQGPAFVMPNGLKIFYRNLHFNEDGDLIFDKVMGKNLVPTKTYGAKTVENFTQCLAGLFLRECWAKIVQIGKRTGLFIDGPVVLQVHDELVFLVKRTHAKALLELALDVMATPPLWAPGLPVAGEGDIADTYAGAK